MKDVTCDFCKDKVILAQSDGSRLVFRVGEYQTSIRLKKPQKYFPLECGICEKETRWWREEK